MTLMQHVTRILPGDGMGTERQQIASALVIAKLTSADDADVSEFTGAWWDGLGPDIKSGVLLLLGKGILETALADYDKSQAGARSVASLTQEDFNDLHA